ncbi:MAG: hypothetical protein HW421_2412 [Ignavibacteria bacterium]|nr:hypothetical protein [Ignavibacteria bacterium]
MNKYKIIYPDKEKIMELPPWRSKEVKTEKEEAIAAAITELKKKVFAPKIKEEIQILPYKSEFEDDKRRDILSNLAILTMEKHRRTMFVISPKLKAIISELNTRVRKNKTVEPLIKIIHYWFLLDSKSGART